MHLAGHLQKLLEIAKGATRTMSISIFHAQSQYFFPYISIFVNFGVERSVNYQYLRLHKNHIGLGKRSFMHKLNYIESLRAEVRI